VGPERCVVEWGKVRRVYEIRGTYWALIGSKYERVVSRIRNGVILGDLESGVLAGWSTVALTGEMKVIRRGIRWKVHGATRDVTSRGDADGAVAIEVLVEDGLE
jgi:hypothetical protein